MRTVIIYSALLLLLSAFSAAWPVWPRWMPEIDALIVRKDTSSNTSATDSASATKTASATDSSSSDSSSGTGTITSKASATGTAKSSSGTGSASGSKSGSNSDSASGNSTATGHTTYNSTAATGGIGMVTPASTASTSYYPIGEWITFAWDFTSLEGTPTAVDVLATYSSTAYTIALNNSVPTGANVTQTVLWDTAAYQNSNEGKAQPLQMVIYTLVVYDAAYSISATPSAGYMSVASTHKFGMYTPAAYTSLSGVGKQCALCSAGVSDLDQNALKFMLGTAVVTVLSFTWFVGGTGIIW